MRWRTALWMVAWAGLVTDVARADVEVGVDAARPELAPFWQAAREPAQRRAQELLRQARAQLYPVLGQSALFGGLNSRRRGAIENALARLRRVRRIDPQNPEAWLLTAQALASWEARLPTGEVQRRDAEAIEAFQHLRRVDPRYAAYEVAFELAILYTRAEAFEDAVREWRRALAVELDEPSVVTVLSNLAEVTMMSGDLGEAAELYEKAVDAGAGDARLLALWGQAVALDRLGEHAAALEAARQAIEEDRRPMGVLNAPGVFFVPGYESHYYTALGHLALAGRDGALVAQVCDTPVPVAEALQGATREDLRLLGELSEELETSDTGAPGLRGLAPRAQALLEQRNAAARRNGEVRKNSSAATRELVHVLEAWRDLQAYLAQGGAEGRFAAAAHEHVERLSTCVTPTRARNAPARP